MSTYLKLLQNPPKLEVVKDPREVIVETISCMCDNRHKIKFFKNDSGDFKMSGGRFSLSNWQFKHDVDDIEWKADEGKWQEVFAMINMSTEKINTVKSR